MTHPLSPDEIRDHATEILLAGTRDIDALAVSEHLLDLDLPEAEHDAACAAVDQAIRAAIVTVDWHPLYPVDLNEEAGTS